MIFYSKNHFINAIFSDKKMVLKAKIIQTGSTSSLIEKNKVSFLSSRYLQLVQDLCGQDFELLQLANYKISTNAQYYTQIQKSIEKFQNLWKEPIDVIKKHTVYLAIIEPIQVDSREVISSTTFYDYPFCTFITKYGFRYIPPKTIFNTTNAYAIFDNLYHESLHQKLLIQILLGKIFKESDEFLHSNPLIFIPWRAISWEIEHALQAAFVYGHLYQTRLQYSLTLDPGIELNNMIEATTYSKNNAVYLLGELLKFQNFFTEEALNLIKNLALKCQ